MSLSGRESAFQIQVSEQNDRLLTQIYRASYFCCSQIHKTPMYGRTIGTVREPEDVIYLEKFQLSYQFQYLFVTKLHKGHQNNEFKTTKVVAKHCIAGGIPHILHPNNTVL